MIMTMLTTTMLMMMKYDMKENEEEGEGVIFCITNGVLCVAADTPFCPHEKETLGFTSTEAITAY